MDRKTFTIILAAILIGSFFLAYYTLLGSISGFDIVSSSGGNWQKYLWALVPVCGLLLLLGAVNNGNYIPSRGLLCWVPLLTLLYFLLIHPLTNGASFGDVLKFIGKGYGIGLWLTIAASLLLAFYNPKVSKA